MRPRDAQQVDYIGKSPASSIDLVIPFVEFLWQRASWEDIHPLILRIKDDIHNLATALAKIEHFFSFKDSIGNGVSEFVKTEIEYLFVLSRSLFDLLQSAISKIWQRKVELLDETAQKRKRNLPDSFADVVLEGKTRVRTASEIMEKYGVPISLAEAYTEAGPFFSNVKQLRESLVHYGVPIPFVFVTEKGFCTDPKESPFNAFDIWTEAYWYNEKIVSLKPFLAYIVFHTLDACNVLFSNFAQQIQFPDPIAPGYRVFVRHYHNGALVRAKSVLEGGSPWWNEAPKEVAEKAS